MCMPGLHQHLAISSLLCVVHVLCSLVTEEDSDESYQVRPPWAKAGKRGRGREGGIDSERGRENEGERDQEREGRGEREGGEREEEGEAGSERAREEREGGEI